MKQPKDKVKQALSKASDIILEAIASPDGDQVIINVCKKKGLTLPQTAEISSETTLVMLGLTKPEEFVPSIISRAQISEDIARSIAQDINEKIFRPIRDELRKIHGIPTVETIRPPVSANTPPPHQTVPPPANLPTMSQEFQTPSQKPFTPSYQKPSVPSEGLVPLQKKPPAFTPMVDWAKQQPPEARKPIRTMQQDLARATMQQKTHMASYVPNTNEEADLDRESLLKSIENPIANTESSNKTQPAQTSTPKSILESKLSGTTKLAKEEIYMKQNNDDVTPPVKKPSDGGDPYREALN